MQTAETLEIMTDRLNLEISRIASQLERLEDVVLSLDDPQLKDDLRSISANIRHSLEVMRNEFEPEEGWIAG